MGAGFWIGLIAAGGVAGVVIWSVIGWLDRQVGEPVMKERINKGSDKYFDGESRNWGAVTLDSIVRLKFEHKPEAEPDDESEEPVIHRLVDRTKIRPREIATPQSPSESSPRARVGRSSDSA